MSEDMSASCSRESEGNSHSSEQQQQAQEENSKNSTGPPSIAEESSVDMTISASNTSIRSDSQDLEHSERKALDSTNIRRKTTKEKPKVKVIESRYKAAAAAAKVTNNSSGNNSNSNSNSQSKSRSSETLTAGPVPLGKRLPPKTKPKRARPEDMSRSRISALSAQSTTTTTTTTTTTGAQPATLRFQPPPRSGLGSDAKPKTSKPDVGRPSKVASKAVLHSTALNATLMGDVSNLRSGNMLSSTLLGGITPGGFKQTPAAAAALMELPDISVIKPEGNNSGNRTILSSVGEEPQNDSDRTPTTLPEVTADMLEQEYLRYLQWAYVDVNSELSFAAQLRDAQNQIVFLEELVSTKQEEVSELRQKKELFAHHQRVGKAFDNQTRLLQTLIDDIPACEEAEKTMEKELEKKLHQVKMENIYLPQDHTKYREDLTEALGRQISLLHNLQGLLEPRNQNSQATLSLQEELQEISERVQRCEKEMQQAVGLAIEGASHQLGAKPICVDDCADVAKADYAGDCVDSADQFVLKSVLTC